MFSKGSQAALEGWFQNVPKRTLGGPGGPTVGGPGGLWGALWGPYGALGPYRAKFFPLPVPIPRACSEVSYNIPRLPHMSISPNKGTFLRF